MLLVVTAARTDNVEALRAICGVSMVLLAYGILGYGALLCEIVVKEGFLARQSLHKSLLVGGLDFNLGRG